MDESPQPTSSELSTPSQEIEIVPERSWWAVSLGVSRRITIQYGHETSNGDLVFWGQEKRSDGEVFRDLIIRFSANGQLLSTQRISPSSARVFQAQWLPDNGMALTGFDEEQGYAFSVAILENGDSIVTTNRVDQSRWRDKWFVRLAGVDSPPLFGRVEFRGGRTGTQVVDAYATLPEGTFIAAGPIHGTTTGSDGGIYPRIDGIWAIGINENNQVIWKKAFETSAIPISFGAIMRDGRIGLSWSTDYYSDSFVLIDHSGNVLYWKHYSTSSSIQALGESSDGGIYLVGGPADLMKLTKQGEVVCMKDLDTEEAETYTQYAFEGSNGDLILALGSAQEGTVISRFRIDDSFPGCNLLSLKDGQVIEIQRRVPVNIGASVEARPEFREWFFPGEEISIEDRELDVEEICRYVLQSEAP
jgi:hypothetical protein